MRCLHLCVSCTYWPTRDSWKKVDAESDAPIVDSQHLNTHPEKPSSPSTHPDATDCVNPWPARFGQKWWQLGVMVLVVWKSHQNPACKHETFPFPASDSSSKGAWLNSLEFMGSQLSPQLAIHPKQPKNPETGTHAFLV